MEEYRQYLSLVGAVVSGSCAPETRREAEMQLGAVHRSSSCRLLLDFLRIAVDSLSKGENVPCGSENVLFFIGQGLHIFVWRYWSDVSFTHDQQETFTRTIANVLLQHFDILPVFVRSKLEQVLAGICGMSCSLDPALSLVVEYGALLISFDSLDLYSIAGQPGFDCGLSAMRTVCEELLQDDPRILPASRKALLSAITEVAEPLSNVICSVCKSYLQNGGNSRAASDSDASKNISTLHISLQLLRILVMKLPVGSHLSSELLQCLFHVCEIDSLNNLAPANNASQAQNQQAVHRSTVNAIVAVEVLTEIMSKRYIPPSTSMTLLVELAGQAVGLLYKFRSQESLDAFETSLPLLEFVRVFVESHIERAVIAGTSGATPEILPLIESFLGAFSSLTQASREPEILYKMILVWEGLMAYDAAKEFILSNSSCLQSGYHIFREALMQNNELLAEVRVNIDSTLDVYQGCCCQLCDEVEEELDLDPFRDSKAREMLSHVLNKESKEENKAQVNQDQGESGNIGYSMLVSVIRCVTMFAESVAFCAQLQGDARGALDHTLSQLSEGKGGGIMALDCSYLLRLMPLFMSPSELIPHLLPLVQNMAVERSYSQGKAHAYLFQRSCQLIESLIRHALRECLSNNEENYDRFVEYTKGCLSIALSATDVSVSPPPSYVMGSSVIFLSNVMDIPEEVVSEMPSKTSKEFAHRFSMTLRDRLGADFSQLYERSSGGALPIEVCIIVTCSVSRVFSEAIQSVGSLWSQTVIQALEQGWSVSLLSTLIRATASLEALVHSRSDSKLEGKQTLLSSLEQGQVCQLLPRGLESLLGQAKSSASSGLILQAASSLLSLSASLLRNLGKKAFFAQAASVLMTSHSFVTGLAGEGAEQLLFQGAGLEVSSQLLRLTHVIAASSSSSTGTASEQIDVTLQLLGIISGALNDKTACVELLEEVLQCGWTCVKCYWQNTRRPGSEMGADTLENGATVKPLVVMLMQIFCACMDPDVAPHDALLSVEGPLKLNAMHNMFALDWFKDQCWADSVSACIKVILLRIHTSHHDTISDLLKALCADIFQEVAATNSANDSQHVQFIYHQVLEIAASTDSSTGEQVAKGIFDNALSQQPLSSELLIDHILNPIATIICRSQDK